MRFEAKLANNIPQDEKRRSEFVQCVLHFPTRYNLCFVLICVASDMCRNNLLISSFFSRLESSGLSLPSSWPMIALEFGS